MEFLFLFRLEWGEPSNVCIELSLQWKKNKGNPLVRAELPVAYKSFLDLLDLVQFVQWKSCSHWVCYLFDLGFSSCSEANLSVKEI